jgi:ABC-type branched-subunit amino acid transport system substrate-binding protein
VKIGLIAPFEGADRAIGYDALAGVRLALHEQNRQAGAYRFELVALDDHHDGTGKTAAQRAAELVADPRVVAVVGGFGDGSARGAASVLAAAGVPFVIAGAADGSVPTRGVIRLPPDEEALARQVLVWAKGWGERRWYLAGDGALAGAMRQAFSQAGWAVTPQLGEATAVFFAGGDPVEAALLVERLRAGGSDALFVGGPALDTPRFSQVVGADAVGVFYVSLAGPPAEGFAAAFRGATGTEPTSAATLAYRATETLLMMAKHTSPLTRDKLLKALRERRTTISRSSVGLHRLDSSGYPGTLVSTER